MIVVFECVGLLFIGVDVGELVGLGNLGVVIKVILVENLNFDLFIDFICLEGMLEYIVFCVVNYKKMVIGMIGFDDVGK